MAADRNRDTYEAGGFSAGNTYYMGSGPSDMFGRIWNNFSGVTAQNQFNAMEAEKAREFNSAEAAKDRDWQEYMSNTAYQRQVEDMKAAGINPASIGGDGASVPGGATASASPASASGSSGSGGFLGLIGGLARVALASALYRKFSNSANRSPSAAGAVSKIGQDLSETRLVYNKNGVLKGSIETNRRMRDVFQ